MVSGFVATGLKEGDAKKVASISGSDEYKDFFDSEPQVSAANTVEKTSIVAKSVGASFSQVNAGERSDIDSQQSAEDQLISKVKPIVTSDFS